MPMHASSLRGKICDPEEDDGDRESEQGDDDYYEWESDNEDDVDHEDDKDGNDDGDDDNEEEKRLLGLGDGTDSNNDADNDDDAAAGLTKTTPYSPVGLVLLALALALNSGSGDDPPSSPSLSSSSSSSSNPSFSTSPSAPSFVASSSSFSSAGSMMMMAIEGCVALLQALLNLGADPNSGFCCGPQGGGHTPLSLAKLLGVEALLVPASTTTIRELLIAAGASPAKFAVPTKVPAAEIGRGYHGWVATPSAVAAVETELARLFPCASPQPPPKSLRSSISSSPRLLSAEAAPGQTSPGQTSPGLLPRPLGALGFVSCAPCGPQGSA